MARETRAVARIPLVGSPTNRSSDESKDQRFINCFPEVIGNEITGNKRVYLTKRAGTRKYVQPAGATGEGRGVYAWFGYLYTAIGNRLYATNLTTNTVTNIKTLANATGAVGFTEASMAGLYLVVSDGVSLYYIASGTLTTCTTLSNGYPTPHYPSPVYMDGYIFVQKTSTAEIYNSANSSITGAWSGVDFITPEQYPDGGIGIARQNNMLVSLGSNSVEFFFNAANATGSPLGVNSQATIQFGCGSLTSVAQQEGLICMVAQSQTGGYFVVAIDGFQPHNISNNSIEKILEDEALLSAGLGLAEAWGYFVRTKGHLFYVLNLPNTDRTVVYDMELKMWHEWNFQNNTDIASPTFALFPMIGIGDNAGATLMLHSADGWVYIYDPATYRDAVVVAGAYKLLRCQIQSSRFDGETNYMKFPTRIEIVGDRQSTSSPATLYFSDDDYQSWKPTAGRSVDFSNNRAYVYRTGQFRRRAFLLVHSANTPLRLESIEMELEKGIH